jgi:hypothetical protein
MVLLAIVVAVVWSITGRYRREYHTLNCWLRSFVRYALAMNLFAYGIPKVFPVQMLPVRLYTTGLLIPFGDKTPAGVLWSFMGYSIPYQMFSGAAEVLAAILLLPRRTVTLGALISVAVLSNVVLLNFSYDVGVKLFSTNLLLAAIFLVLPDLSKLVGFFVLNQAVEPPTASGPARTGRWLTAGSVAFKVLLAVFVYRTIVGAYAEFRLQASIPDRTPLYGIYDVESFERNGTVLPPLLTDRVRWKRIVMETPQVVQVQLMDDSFEMYRAAHDSKAGRITLSKGSGKGAAYVLEYTRVEADRLRIFGRADNDVLNMMIRRVDLDKFLLRSWGFHWIQERSLTR